ncbi:MULTISPECIES: hypothetical protein [unclassified Microcoleus]|uniref:hypothetical protein n=1 Tax=unclassified Microcoleus TaxID=2642155 RepID=UPI002FD5FED1
MMNALIYYFFNFSNKTLRRFDFLGANLKNATICDRRLDIKLIKQFGNFSQIERYAARLNLTSWAILKNRQDACSTIKFTLCGTGILPVHKKLLENGATSQINQAFLNILNHPIDVLEESAQEL